ncbi:MAG: hypothetical protein Q8L85_00210 [Alphaproteobacteria bacterium]|nr:hypothetical protein [Alphaproteobacteria bacterium]
MNFKKIFLGSLLGCFLLSTVDTNAQRPITQGQWGIGLHGGIAPHFFTRKAGTTLIVNSSTYNNIIIKQRTFSRNFAAPVIGRGEITYAIMDDLEGFVDADYVFAQGQTIKLYHKPTPNFTLGPVANIRTKNQSLHEVGLHLGLRHYTDIGSDITPFLGCKFGGRYRNNVQMYHLFDGAKVDSFRFLRGGVSFSAGAELGLNYNFALGFSLILKGEILGITSYHETRWASDYTKNGIRSRLYSSDQVHKIYSGKDVVQTLGTNTLQPYRAAISLPITLGLKIHL